VSETRDLGVPLLAFLAGLGVAVWNATTGHPLEAVLAALVGLGVGGASLLLTLKRGPGPATALALGGVLGVAALTPLFAGNRDVLVPLGLAVAAFAIPGKPRPNSVRMAGLVLAGVLALFGAFLATRKGTPKSLSGYALAAAFAVAWAVVRARALAIVPIPKGPRVGVYGGSFDPFHVGHREVCERALEVLDRVLVVVSARPPHKAGEREITPFHHRVALSRLGVEGLPRIEVVEIENRRDGPSYTVDTLEALRKMYPPGTQFRLILGSDSFQEFPLWKDWEGILERATLLVAARPGWDVEAPPEFEGRNAPVEILTVDPQDVSSTEIRRRVAAGISISGLVSPAVAAYLRDHVLYQATPTPPGAEEPGASAGEPPNGPP
jgi:nicotinate-nucleotide adenylyltransferase